MALGITVLSDTSGNTDTADKAREADLAIVVGATTCGEEMDRADLSLDDNVNALIGAVAATGTPTVVIAQTPGTLVMPWRDVVKSIAVMFLGGQETGAAWANVLFGDAVPVGRLPLVIPQSEEDTIKPDQDLSVQYTEGMATSYRKAGAVPAFPFGHGLTYTSFQYAKPRNRMCEDDWCIELDIENIGQVSAPEVVQLYLELPSEAGWPTPLLKGFQKTEVLSPGSITTVTFRITGQDRSYYADLPGASWLQVSKEDCIAHIGASSADIRQSIQGSEASGPPAPIAGVNFYPMDGASDRACRGPGGQNLASYYTLEAAGSLDDCKEQCASLQGCTGIEWNPNGRCEVWTTAITASVAVSNFECFSTESQETTPGPTTEVNFSPVDGGADRACRGPGGQNSASYYSLKPARTLDDCKNQCASVQGCTGIEWNPDGRCEVWAIVIEASAPVDGYTCMQTVASSSDSLASTSATPVTTTVGSPQTTSVVVDICYGELSSVAADEGVGIGDKIDTLSSEECKRVCTENEQCQSFAFCPHFEGCWMKSKALSGNEPTRDFYDCSTFYKKTCAGVSQPTSSPTPAADWFGTGKVTQVSFWEGMRGIGFSPTDDRGVEWYMSRESPAIARLEDALTKLVDNGFTMIRTWRTGSYEELVLERIRARNLDIKVQFGADIDNDGHAEQLIDQALKVASKYPEYTLGLSVGNERIGLTRQLSPQQVLRHAEYAKRKYGIPVTYNFYEYTIPGMSNDDLDLIRGLDYVNVHLYGGHHGKRYDGSWTPQQQLLAVRDEQMQLMDKIGSLNKCVIIGETGWQSRGYAASSISRAQEYYIAVTRYVYSKGPHSPALAMFYFNLNDEWWKGGDDGWGLYVQGDGERLGEPGSGSAKFPVTKVPDILHPRQNVYEKSSLAGGWGGWCTCPDGQRYNVGDRLDGCENGPASLACEGGVPDDCNKIDDSQRKGMMVTCAAN